MMRKNIPPLAAFQALGYSPTTGAFTKQSVCSATGYSYVSVDGQSIQAHRAAWFIMTGEWPSSAIDHRDGIRGNNKWENLRLATPTQNLWNMKVTNKSKSGIKGVYFDTERGKWAATICVYKKRISLGRFFEKEDAVKAYRVAANRYFGEFARAA